MTDWAWAPRILLIGLAVVSVTGGLFGLYPQINERTPRVAFTGAISTGIARIAALSLVVSIGIALVAELAMATSLPQSTGVFVVIALSMTGGFSLGVLQFGIAVRRITTNSCNGGQLLVVGGLLLLAPVVVETLGVADSVYTPPLGLLPILGAVAIDTLVVGYLLSQGVYKQHEDDS